MDYQHGTTTTTTATNTPRPGTPDSDPIEAAPRSNPFQTPYGSMPASTMGSSTGVQHIPPPRYFHSRRINKEEAEKPWLDKKDPKEKWVWIIPVVGALIGIGLAGFSIYEGIASHRSYQYCPVLDDTFANGIDTKTWTYEVQVGGFGTGEFEETTNTDENAFVQDGMLYIKPTLQDAQLVEQNNVINLLNTTCTSNTWANCVTSTNTTNHTIVNPVKSARLTTNGHASIKYGRVEVEAQLPVGDWMWPAIWMLPVNNTYGAWPASGEIDIMESRGNNYTYPSGGDNVISSTLHWGPDPDDDAYWKTDVKRTALHTTYASGFHIYGLEWSEKYIFTYIDTRLAQVLYTPFSKSFWTRGDFPVSSSNGTALSDPWDGPGTSDATPFDQDFYLILNVAVGGTNGWFTDGVASKPWVDASPTAKLDFWNARDQWYPTWQDKGEMIIKSVKMWQQQGYNGCMV